MRLKEFLKSNSFILLIIAVLVFSILVPTPGMLVNDVNITPYLTFTAMFASGLGLSFSNIKEGIKDWKSIIYSFASVYIIFPLITLGLLLALGQTSGDVFIGSIILAAQSSTLASAVVLTATANGNVPLALIITIINNMSAAVMTPLVLKLALSSEQAVSLPVGAMILKLLLVLVLPVILAQFTRRLFKKFVEVIQPYTKAVSKFVVLVIVLTGASAASSEILNHLGTAMLIILLVAALHIIMLFVSSLYLRIVKAKRETKSAVLFTSTQKTLPASLLIWESYFASYTLAPLVLVLHHMVQLIIDSFVVNRLGKRRNKDDEQG